jgi:hypothetical protein
MYLLWLLALWHHDGLHHLNRLMLLLLLLNHVFLHVRHVIDGNQLLLVLLRLRHDSLLLLHHHNITLN